MKSQVVMGISIGLFVITFAMTVTSFVLAVALLSGTKFKKLHIGSIQADSVSANLITANSKINTKGTVSANYLTADAVQVLGNVMAETVTAKAVAATENVYATNGIFGNKTTGNGYVYSNNSTNSVPYFASLSSAYNAGYCWPGITSSNCAQAPAQPPGKVKM